MGDSGISRLWGLWIRFHSCLGSITRWKEPRSKWCDSHDECHSVTGAALGRLMTLQFQPTLQGTFSCELNWHLSTCHGCVAFGLGPSPEPCLPTWLQVCRASKYREVNAPREPATTGSWQINSCPSLDYSGRHSACFSEGLADELLTQCLWQWPWWWTFGCFFPPSLPCPPLCFLGSPPKYITCTQVLVSVLPLGVHLRTELEKTDHQTQFSRLQGERGVVREQKGE